MVTNPAILEDRYLVTRYYDHDQSSSIFFFSTGKERRLSARPFVTYKVVFYGFSTDLSISNIHQAQEDTVPQSDIEGRVDCGLNIGFDVGEPDPIQAGIASIRRLYDPFNFTVSADMLAIRQKEGEKNAVAY
jgi:hypothetical protein